MEHTVGSVAEDKLVAILKVLSESSEPLGSIVVARRLEQDGVFLSERAVRYHLIIADEHGFTRQGGWADRTIIPASARGVVEEKIARLKEIGIGGVYPLGYTSEPLYQIPISLNRIGVVQLGGLNPVAAAVEAGIDIENIAQSGMIDYQQLYNYSQLQAEYCEFICRYTSSRFGYHHRNILPLHWHIYVGLAVKASSF